MSETDVRLPAEIKADAEALWTSDLNSKVAQGLITKSQANAVYKAAFTRQPTIRYKVVLSATGSQLLFLKKDLGFGDIVMVYDGKSNQYIHRANATSKTRLVDVKPGLGGISALWGIPLPGLGVPSIPLITAFQNPVVDPAKTSQIDARSPIFWRGPAPDLVLVPSRAVYAPGGDIASVALGNDPDKPTERWDFSLYKPFNGRRIASSIIFTTYQGSRIPKSAASIPATTLTFRLISASSEAQPAKAFDYSSYLESGDMVGDRVNNVDFLFEPGKTINEQIQRASFLRDQRKYENGQAGVKKSSLTGVLSICCLGLLASASIWRWRSLQKSNAEKRG